MGFAARPIDGRWIVTRSAVAGLRAGAVIEQIAGDPADAFFGARRRYMSASNDRWARRTLFEYPYLFPQRFDVQLAGRATVAIMRSGEFRWPGTGEPPTSSRLDGDALWVRVPSFAKPQFEADALKAISGSHARVLVVDVRGNHGGSTPSELIDALMDRRYRWWAEAASLGLPLFAQQGSIGGRPVVAWQSTWSDPPKTVDKRPLYILINGGCYSACEDFVVRTRRGDAVARRNAADFVRSVAAWCGRGK